MATTEEHTSTKPNADNCTDLEFFRLRSAIDVDREENNSNSYLRGMLTPMAVTTNSDEGYTVHEGGESFTTDWKRQECSCTEGQKIENYICKHQHHVRYREQNNLIDPPERPDLVIDAGKDWERIANEQRKVTLGENEMSINCLNCETEIVVEQQQESESCGVCEDCAENMSSVVYLRTPDVDEMTDSVVGIVGRVDDKTASSYYPEGESVFSLADIFGDVEGVEKTDSVVVVREVIGEQNHIVFGEDERVVPQGALREIVSED